ncbi:hypothetical protein [Spiroplasma endosymbiont of Labia minor]
MNLANKITILRLILFPLAIVLLLISGYVLLANEIFEQTKFQLERII